MMSETFRQVFTVGLEQVVSTYVHCAYVPCFSTHPRTAYYAVHKPLHVHILPIF